MKYLVLLLGCGLLLATNVQAQNVACSRVQVNPSGASGADVTVGSTPITVKSVLSSRCGGLILNSGTAAMRCAPAGQPLSTTQGFPVVPGAAIVFGTEGQEEWLCIRTTATNTSASVMGAVP